MVRTQLLRGDDLPARPVAFALELLDPVTGRLVSAGVDVTVAGRDTRPIVNPSGRFVWIGRTELWPTTLSVAPGTLPFEPIEDLDVASQRPARWPDVSPHERVVRVRLRPTAIYPFEDGVTAVRGVLFESLTAAAPRQPIHGAEVWFEWAVAGTIEWETIDPACHVRTDARGEFAVFDRVPSVMNREPDMVMAKLHIRIVVSHDGEERRTPADFQFLPAPAPRGRVPEGIALANTVALAWDTLS